MSDAPNPEAANPPLFKRGRRRGANANLRKRAADDGEGALAAADGAPEADIVRGGAGAGPRPAKQARQARQAEHADQAEQPAAADGQAPKVEYHYRRAMDATRTEEHTAPAEVKANRAAKASADNADSTDNADSAGDMYRGQKAYTNRAAGTGSMRAGPVRAPTNVRTTSVVDYQPNVCKDYKETGFCGYGDSCIFLHDRGVYKTGWQLEKEFEEQQRQQGVRRDDPRLWQTERDGAAADKAAAGSSKAAEVPFACLICRKPFKDPVVTRCQHYFCEACALARYRKSPKCLACGAATGGAFKRAKGLAAKQAP
ncbi:RNA-splicing factor [Coemansia javaensis]|uniref:Pre-mRNA-splicing factor CWC24 n=1 Tax=Coemansia javaensis TaxID=2761396 RepID=A0A9W8LIG8_9FUNG|nr:RNA-splicing factor [Coemansia javaensis]